MVARAQTGSNVSTALANTVLGNANEYTPYGSVTYQQNGQTFIPNDPVAYQGGSGAAGASGGANAGSPYGSSGAASGNAWSPNGQGNANNSQLSAKAAAMLPPGASGASGGLTKGTPGYYIPQYSKTTTLAPAQQKMLDLQNQTGVGLNQIALKETGAIGGLLSNPVTPDQLMPLGQTPTNPQLSGLPDGPEYQLPTLNQQGGSGPVQQGVNVQNAPTSLGQSGDIQGAPTLGQASLNVPNAGQIQNGLDQPGPIASAPNVGLAGANVPSAGSVQDALAGTGQVQGSLGSGGRIQQGVQSAGYNPNFAQSGNIQNSIGPTDYSADRTNVENAIYSRLDPELQRQKASLENTLVNQGFQRGTQGFNTSMDEFNRQSNDAHMQAVLAGGQEQSRLANLALQSGQFANQAQQQGYGQDLGRGQFGQTAAQLQNQQALNAGNFSNQAQAQRFGQNLAGGQFANQAQNQAVNQALTSQGQQFGQNLAGSQFGLAATGQNNQALLAQQQAANAAQAQGFGQDLAAGQFSNTAQQQQFGQNLAGQQYGLSALGQNNQAQLAQQQAANQAQQQEFGQNLSSGQYGLSAMGQNNAANLAGGQFANQAQAQSYAQQQAQLAFNNTVSTQGAEAANAAAQQAYQNTLAQVQQQNQNSQQGFSNQLAGAQLQNASQAQNYQQQLGLQSFPINQISALMSNSQVQVPQGAAYQGGQIAATPVGSYAYNTAALQQQNYQSQLAADAATTGGLFGLGSAGILGGARLMGGGAGGLISDRRLKRDIVDTGIKLLNGLKLYSYRYLWDAALRVGVMADEVKQIRPHAVFNRDGFDVVDYDAAVA